MHRLHLRDAQEKHRRACFKKRTSAQKPCEVLHPCDMYNSTVYRALRQPVTRTGAGVDIAREGGSRTEQQLHLALAQRLLSECVFGKK